MLPLSEGGIGTNASRSGRLSSLRGLRLKHLIFGRLVGGIRELGGWFSEPVLVHAMVRSLVGSGTFTCASVRGALSGTLSGARLGGAWFWTYSLACSACCEPLLVSGLTSGEGGCQLLPISRRKSSTRSGKSDLAAKPASRSGGAPPIHKD